MSNTSLFVRQDFLLKFIFYFRNLLLVFQSGTCNLTVFVCYGDLKLTFYSIRKVLSAFHDTCVSLCICSICTYLLTDLSLLISASTMPVSWLYIMPLAPVSFPNSLSFSVPNSETPRNESDWLSPSLQAIPLMVLIHWGWGIVSHGAEGLWARHAMLSSLI